MKKIIISANTSWYIYNFRANTIAMLKNIGYEVYVVAPRDSYSKKFKLMGAEYVEINLVSDSTNPINELRSLHSFFSIYKTILPSIALHFTPKNNIYGTIASKFLGIKVINNISGLGVMKKKNLFFQGFINFLYLSQNFADYIFFQNKNDKKAIQPLIINKKKLELIPGSGVDLSRFPYKQSQKQNKRVKFLLFSRLIKEKGVYEYVASAKYIKKKFKNQVEFGLLGFIDESNHNSIKLSEIKDWESKGLINYYGVSDNVKEYIEDSDCIILPSFYGEGTPKSLLEALAIGRPIITTKIPGCNDVVENNENGFLCTPESSESLTKEILRFLSLPIEKRAQMGMKSRKKAENEFDEKFVLKKYLDAIEDLS